MGRNTEGSLIKVYDVPRGVRKRNLIRYGFKVIELWSDRVVAKGAPALADRVFMFDNYAGVTYLEGNLLCAFSQLVFINKDNYDTYITFDGNKFLVDNNKLAFCSGMLFSGKANEYAKALCEEIQNLMNKYRGGTDNEGSNS